MNYLLVALGLFLGFSTVQAQPVVLSDPDEAYPVFSCSAALEVPPGKVTINDLLSQPAAYRFVPVSQKPVQPDRRQTYWFRVDLANPTPENYFLQFLYIGDMTVQIYEVDKAQVIQHWQVDFYGVATRNLFQRSRAIMPLSLRQGQTHTLYFYVEHMAIPTLHVAAMSSQRMIKATHYQDLFYGLYYGFILIITIYSLLLGIRLKDRDNVLYAIWAIATGIQLTVVYGMALEFPNSWAITSRHNYGVLIGISCCLHLLFTLSFLQIKQQALWLYRVILVALGLLFTGLAGTWIVYLLGFADWQLQEAFAGVAASLDAFLCLLSGIVLSVKRYKPAYFFTVGICFPTLSTIVFVLSFYGVTPLTFWTRNSILIGYMVEVIFFMLGLTYKVNQLKKNQDKAIQEQLRLTKENQALTENQKRVLEEQVEQRTAQLQESLATLSVTQAQLIQKEKLASLGELTAGIAHEIQNPLNFVNNFSEVSTELVDELQEGPLRHLPDVEKPYAENLVSDLRQNLQKITHHGHRAGSIVRGMLDHSRASSGERQLTDLNQLADEYLRLAYQGQQTKNKLFTCRVITAFDTAVSPINIVSQDIGRVLLNLYTNAFYAVQKRGEQAGAGYQPTVSVGTRYKDSQVELWVKDNGPGIHASIRDKIFQPFFTTKPTGEGTGLGLSLSYDIVTKGHGGSLSVHSLEGEATTFTLTLPV